MCLESLNSANWAKTFCIISISILLYQTQWGCRNLRSSPYRFIQRYVTKVHLFFGFYYICSQLSFSNLLLYTDDIAIVLAA
jgi:hypothetical protein